MKSTGFKRVLVALVVSLAAACSPTDDASVVDATSVQHLFIAGQLFDGSGSAPVITDLGIDYCEKGTDLFNWHC